MKHIVIVGGGAAGLISAIHTKTSTNKVTILERNSQCGKKILATGNGKCNYWNIDQNIKHYHSNNEELLEQIITKEIQDKVINFFNSLGIVPKIKNGYYYPFSNQATTIKNALLTEVNEKDIEIRQDFLVESIEKEDNHFIIISSNEIIKADKVIIATGSCASPKTGSDGIGYKLLKRLSHTVIEPKPALVQLKTTGNFLKEWAGIRTDVKVSLYENDKLIKEESGEIQLTDYGISGICVFNLSRFISRGLLDNKKEEKTVKQNDKIIKLIVKKCGVSEEEAEQVKKDFESVGINEVTGFSEFEGAGVEGMKSFKYTSKTVSGTLILTNDGANYTTNYISSGDITLFDSSKGGVLDNISRYYLSDDEKWGF